MVSASAVQFYCSWNQGCCTHADGDRWGKRSWNWAWCVSDGCVNTSINLLPKQTNKDLEKSLECIFEAGIINVSFIQNMALEDLLCFNSVNQSKAKTLRGMGRDDSSNTKTHQSQEDEKREFFFSCLFTEPVHSSHLTSMLFSPRHYCFCAVVIAASFIRHRGKPERCCLGKRLVKAQGSSVFPETAVERYSASDSTELCLCSPCVWVWLLTLPVTCFVNLISSLCTDYLFPVRI